MGAIVAHRGRTGSSEDAIVAARRALVGIGEAEAGRGLRRRSRDGRDADELTRRCVRRLMGALLGLPGVDARGLESVPGDVATLERVYESLLGVRLVADAAGVRIASGTARRRAGAFYTPAPIVEHLLDTALEPVVAERLAGGETDAARARAILSIRVCDPACGSGRFLVGAVRRLAAHLAAVRSASPGERDVREVVGRCVFGVDLDPVGVALCRAALAREAGTDASCLAGTILEGDALVGSVEAREDADGWCGSFFGSPVGEAGRRARERRFFHWWQRFPGVAAAGGFDVVVGNPPFLGQLASDTAASRGEAAYLRAVSDGVVRGYSDTSIAFLWRSLRLVREGGRVALVQPLSMLSARDAGRVRSWAAERASLTHLWLCPERVFGACVSTCAPTLRAGGPRRVSIARTRGADFEAMASTDVEMDALAAGGTWAPLASDLWGVPRIEVRAGPTIGDIAEATADFRDEYYGLAGALVEDAVVPHERRTRHARVVTTGLIDPASLRWGAASTRIHKRTWCAPRVDPDRLDDRMRAWLERRLVPKVLVATQTRVIEAVADEAGELAPVTPTITVVARGVSVWHLAAAVSSPVACGEAMTRHAGAGLSPDAIKLSARQVLALPCPRAGAAWDAGAAAFRAASGASTESDRMAALVEMGARMVAAAGIAGDDASALLAWWRGRLDGTMRASGRVSGTRGRRSVLASRSRHTDSADGGVPLPP